MPTTGKTNIPPPWLRASEVFMGDTVGDPKATRDCHISTLFANHIDFRKHGCTECKAYLSKNPTFINLTLDAAKKTTNTSISLGLKEKQHPNDIKCRPCQDCVDYHIHHELRPDIEEIAKHVIEHFARNWNNRAVEMDVSHVNQEIARLNRLRAENTSPRS